MTASFGEVAADVLLEHIAAAARSSNRYIIDTLPADEQKAIFDALIRRTNRPIEIPIDGANHSFSAIQMDGVDVVPVLVEADSPGRRNQVSDGWACTLRDVYTAGADVHRPRALVTFTSDSNETQRSASESNVDRSLLAGDALARAVLKRHGITEHDDPKAQALRVYLGQRSHQSTLSETLARMEAFLASADGHEPDDMGLALGELDCLFPDRRQDWPTRLQDNAELFAAVRTVLDDPLEDPEQALTSKIGLEEDSANALIDAGSAGLTGVDFGDLRKRPKQKPGKNSFVRDGIQVSGVSHHHLVTHVAARDSEPDYDTAETGPVEVDEPVVVVATKASFKLELALERPLQGREYVHLVGWDAKKSRLRAEKNAVNHLDSNRVEITVPEPEGFHVWRISIANGPRSFSRYQDCLWVAAYATVRPWLAYEIGCQLSLEYQAWQTKDSQASFERLEREGASTMLHCSRPHDDGAELVDADDLSGDEQLSMVDLGLDAQPLHARVYWLAEGEDGDDDEPHLDWLEEGIYHRLSSRLRERLEETFKKHEHYLGAVQRIDIRKGMWDVRLGQEVSRLLRRWNEFGEEHATGRILNNPDIQWLSVDESDGEPQWTPHLFASEVTASLAPFLDVRRRLFATLYDSAVNLLPSQHGAEPSLDVPLALINLQAHQELIQNYLAAWINAYERVTPHQTEFSAAHRALLELDTLKHFKADSGELERLTILPCHPWLLWSMLGYQQIVGEEIKNMSTSRRERFKLHLTWNEVAQLVRPTPFDDWYDGATGKLHLCRIDGPPFHWRFVPQGTYRRRGGLEYLSRVVHNKIKRYLQIHRHLDHHTRTLRIGFVNPGDGSQLLQGILAWVRTRVSSEHAEIPNIEVLLFGQSDETEAMGEKFDEFFKRSLTRVQEDRTTHALLEKLRYLKLDRKCPESERDYVHICFVNELVPDARFQTKDRRIADGWDGCFGDGLLATPVRSSRKDGEHRRTEHGLWIADDTHSPGRKGLTQIEALLRGRANGSVDRVLGLFWGAELPTLSELHSMYEHSDWIVHLDRALGLEAFHDLRLQDTDGENAPAPVVIEYSDQEEPETPGYDTITVTRHAQPYVDQLGKVLDFNGLPIPDDDDAQRRYGQALVRDINTISGSWALDFIEGNMSQEASGTRLKGHVGVALTYRWLRRVEMPRLRKRHGGNVLPVYISLEELIRVTGSAGLPLKEGLLRRSIDDGHTRRKDDERLRICDDLLILYLMPGDRDMLQMVGRVVEVKFAVNPRQYMNKAIAQVSKTQEILKEYLSGDPDRRDAIFRGKQLSLLLKSRIEQLRLMEPDEPLEFQALDVNRLSAQLAAGKYRVDYTSGYQGRHIVGDVFLLHTSEEGDMGQADVQVESGVRIVELRKATLDWLAFQPEDARTMPGAPTDTLPELGRYRDSMVLDLAGEEAPAQESATVGDELSEPPRVDQAASNTRQIVADAEPEPVVETLSPPSLDSGAGELDSGPAHFGHYSEPVEANLESESVTPGEPTMSLADASRMPIKQPSVDSARVAEVVRRLERALGGHKIGLEAPPSVQEAEIGPRLVRVYVRLRPGQPIQNVRRISEDLARDVGTQSPDVHICNVPEKHSIGIDLPIDGLSYPVDYSDLLAHPSFAAAQREMALGFCAGIDVTGTPHWVDLATMPHALVAGTTGSGKTVFLRQLLLTLLRHKTPRELQIRLSSSKPMDFRLFERAPHAGSNTIAADSKQALTLVHELVDEMDRRIDIISEAMCDNLKEYNQESSEAKRLPYVVAIIDEFAETVLSFEDKSERTEFEKAVARLAQKARAAGIHMVLCMQRPDSAVIQGPIKANILHRFALKLPQNHDSRVILDESGAETLLGHGDLLYKDANSRLLRLQVPNLEKRILKEMLLSAGSDGSV